MSSISLGTCFDESLEPLRCGWPQCLGRDFATVLDDAGLEVVKGAVRVIIDLLLSNSSQKNS